MLKDINIEQIIGTEFWFRNPGLASLPEILFWLSLFSLITIIGIAILLYNRYKIGHYPPKNKIFKPAGIVLIVIGAFGEVFSLFRWQGIDFLGVRAILLLIFIAALSWGVYIFFLYRARVPAARKAGAPAIDGAGLPEPSGTRAPGSRRERIDELRRGPLPQQAHLVDPPQYPGDRGHASRSGAASGGGMPCARTGLRHRWKPDFHGAHAAGRTLRGHRSVLDAGS